MQRRGCWPPEGQLSTLSIVQERVPSGVPLGCRAIRSGVAADCGGYRGRKWAVDFALGEDEGEVAVSFNRKGRQWSQCVADMDGELRPGGREAAELAECRPFSRRRSPRPGGGQGGGRVLAWVAVGVAGADVTLARVVRRLRAPSVRRRREEGEEERSGQQEGRDARHPCGSCSHTCSVMRS